jgi:hypothetical protein
VASNTPAISTALSLVDRFTGPLRAMRFALAPFGSAFKTVAGAALHAGAAFAKLSGFAASATGVVGAAVGSFANSASDIRRFAAQVGVSSEALQEFRLVASGLGIETDKIDDGLKELALRMAELRAGEGALSGLLENVSPKLRKQLMTVTDTEEAFTILVQAMNQLSNAGDRLLLSESAFGGSGETIARFAELGAAGLAKARVESRAYGVQSDETLAKTQEAAKAWNNAKKSIVGLSGAIASELAPVLAPMVKHVASWVQANRGVLSQRLAEYASALGAAIKSIDWQAVSDAARDMWQAVKPLIEAVAALVTKHWGAIKAFTAVTFDAIKHIVSTTVAALVRVLNEMVAPILDAVSGIKQAFTGLADFIAGVFTLDMDLALSGIKDIVLGVGKVFSSIADTIMTAWSILSDWFVKLWDKFAPDPLKRAWEAFAGAIGAVFDAMKTPVNWLADKLLWIAEKLAWIVETISGLNPVAALGDAVNAAFGAVKSSVDSARGAGAGAGTLAAGMMQPPASTDSGWISDVLGKTRTPDGKIVIDFRNMPANVTATDESPQGAKPVTLNTGKRSAGG